MDRLERNSGSPQSVLAWLYSDLVERYTFDGTTGTIFCILAHITLVMLFVSPLPTLLRIREKKSTEKFLPYPYMAAAMYFMVLTYYGLQLHQFPHAFRFLCLQFSSLIGLLVFAQNCLIFAAYTTTRNKVIVICLPVVVMVVWLAMFLYFRISWMETVGDAYVVSCMLRTYLLGPLVVFFGAFMYGSPLFIVKRVFMTRSTKYMPFWFSLASFLNGLLWLIYACLPQTFDLYIAIANGIGALSGFLQLIVFFVFYVRQKDTDRFQTYEEKQNVITWSCLSRKTNPGLRV